MKKFYFLLVALMVGFAANAANYTFYVDISNTTLGNTVVLHLGNDGGWWDHIDTSSDRCEKLADNIYKYSFTWDGLNRIAFSTSNNNQPGSNSYGEFKSSNNTDYPDWGMFEGACYKLNASPNGATITKNYVYTPSENPGTGEGENPGEGDETVHLYITGEGGVVADPWAPTTAVELTYNSETGLYTYTFVGTGRSFKLSTVKADWKDGFDANAWTANLEAFNTEYTLTKGDANSVVPASSTPVTITVDWANKKISCTGTAVADKYETVYFRNTDNWSDVYAYYWNGNAANTTVKMTAAAESDVYSVTVKNTTPGNVIFKNKEGWDDVKQTADYKWVDGNIYVNGEAKDYEGVKYVPASTPDPVAVTGVTLDKTSAEIEVGETLTLTATVAPANADDKTVTWSSSDETVATVAAGVVTAVKAGNATITVTTKDGGKTATCAVTVKAKGEQSEDPETPALKMYLVGLNVNGAEEWGDKYEMTHVENNVYTITVSELGSQFKFYSGNWEDSDHNYGTDNQDGYRMQKDFNYCLRNGQDPARIKTVNDETYYNVIVTIDLDGYDGRGSCVITDAKTNPYKNYNVQLSCNANNWKFNGDDSSNKIEAKYDYDGIFYFSMNKLGGYFKVKIWDGSKDYILYSADNRDAITSNVWYEPDVQEGMNDYDKLDAIHVDSTYETGEVFIYVDVKTKAVKISKELTGVEAVVVEEVAPVYYNLNGVRVAEPANGLYIVVRGNKVTKEIIR